MTSQNMLTLILAFAAASVQADNCGLWSKGTCPSSTDIADKQFKATLTDLYCDADISGTSCSGTCCEDKKICATTAGTCDSGKVYDTSKAETAVANAAEYKTACCTDKPACSTITCSGGWKAKATTGTCSGTTCTHLECCDVKDMTCAGLKAAFTADQMDCNRRRRACAKNPPIDTHEADTSADAKAVTLANAESTCCKKKSICAAFTSTGCGTGKVYDTTLASTALTAGSEATEFPTKCCKDALKCKSHTCAEGKGWVADTTKDTTECHGSGCTDAQCCKADVTKCRGHAKGTCDTNFFDNSDSDALGGTAVTATDWKDKCCKEKTTCQEAKDWVAPKAGTTSGSLSQHEPVMACFLAVFAALAFRK